jgi:hypothetical protein
MLLQTLGQSPSAQKILLISKGFGVTMRTFETAPEPKISLKRRSAQFRANLDEIGTYGKADLFTMT